MGISIQYICMLMYTLLRKHSVNMTFVIVRLEYKICDQFKHLFYRTIKIQDHIYDIYKYRLRNESHMWFCGCFIITESCKYLYWSQIKSVVCCTIAFHSHVYSAQLIKCLWQKFIRKSRGTSSKSKLEIIIHALTADYVTSHCLT